MNLLISVFNLDILAVTAIACWQKLAI